MRTTQPYDEKDLLLRIQESDENTFELLLHTYWNTVFSHALAYLKCVKKAEELTQDVFMNIWKGREKLSSVQCFRDYLFITTRNRILNETRKRLSELYMNNLPDPLEVTDPARTTEYRETYQILMRGIELLPEKRKRVFKMSRLEGMSNEQIAETLSIHRDTVYQYLAKSVTFLRLYLRDHTGYTALSLMLGATQIFRLSV